MESEQKEIGPSIAIGTDGCAIIEEMHITDIVDAIRAMHGLEESIDNLSYMVKLVKVTE